MKFGDMAKSTYFTTSAAPYALSTYNGTPRAAGLPRPNDFFVNDPTALPSTGMTALNGNPGTGWMSVNTAVGYRALIGLKDANNVIHLSSPSGRIIVQNPADISAGVGTMNRAAGIVTVTASHSYRRGDTFTVSPGEANFPAGTKTVSSIAAGSFAYTEAGAGAANTIVQTISSGLKNVVAGMRLPSGLTAGSHFIQLYRTLMVPGAGSDPGDEHRQVFERFITATDIANSFISITDTCPESAFRGANLYTNPISGDGPTALNVRPPIANDMCVWDNRMWFAQTTDRHRLTFRILGIGSPSGLQTGDVLCLGPNAFVLGTSTLISQWSPSQNIALSIAAITNTHNAFAPVTPTAFCYALDDGSVYPPSILFEESGVGGAAFYAACSRSSAIAERLPVPTAVTVAASGRTANVVTITAPAHGFTSGDSIMLAAATVDANFAAGLKTSITVTGANTFTYAESGANAVMGGAYYVYAATYASDNNRLPLRYSKQLDAESVPLLNYPLGLPDNATVLRIAPLQDKLYVFLQYGDIYRVSGTWPYQVKKFDGTAQLLAADTLVEHAGRLHALTTQGVVAISDGGVEVLSFDIEPGLDPLEGTALSTIATQAFAVSYESERQYQLWLPSAAGQSDCAQAYVYNSLTRDWTRWVQEVGGGIVNPVTGKLVLGAGDENTLRVENKAYARADYADDVLTLSATAVVSNSIAVSSVSPNAFARIVLPAYIDGSPLGFGPILINSTGGGQIASSSDAYAAALAALIAGSGPQTITVRVAMSTAVTPVPDFASAPDAEKQWRESKLHFAFFDVQTPAVECGTEKMPFANAGDPTAQTATPSAGNWPQYSGTLEADALPPVVIRMDVPEDCERAVLLIENFVVTEAVPLWRLCGVTTTGEPVSERTGT
jgi:hypothetical protein